MATIDSYTASNIISDYWQEGNSVEIEDVSLEDSPTLDQIRKQVQKPLKDRVEIIESNKNFTVSIIDGTIRVKELPKEVKASKVLFWSRQEICYAALGYLFSVGFVLIAVALSRVQAFQLDFMPAYIPLLSFFFCFWSFIISLKAKHQKSAWEANLPEDIAKLRQYVFIDYLINNRLVKKTLVDTVARKYPGFSSSFYYACLGKNGYKRLIEGDSLFKPSKADPLSYTFGVSGYLRA